ncbi:MAG: ATP-binding cassette domain-containing protein [Cellulosilyticum sp.]|nr:ATP-binding cassette domain-containing protein [Cellulosilyticum sp.]
MRLLELKNINKTYKLNETQSFHALKNINVSFNKGELVSIIGESGSGKSTMMNLIGGLDSHFEGELLVEGQNIGAFTEKQLDAYRKDQIGFVFQNCNLIPHLSILENVTIALTLSNVDKKERIAKAKEALAQVGLEKHINKRPNQLSGGQRQRVAIARALINDPEIILADEPTGALDSETTEQVLAIIKEIAQKGKLVIMVTHSEKVAAHSSRVIQILDGEIIKDITNDAVVLDASSPTENVTTSAKQKGQNLSFTSAILLAANNMKQKLKRNILVALGVSIGIMSVVSMLSLGDGIKAYFNSMIESFMNPLVVEVSMKQEALDLNDPMAAMQALGAKIPFKEENLKELSEIEGVVEVEKGFQYISMTPTNTLVYGDKTSNLMGLTSMSSVITESNVAVGHLPNTGELLINKSVYEEFGEDVIGQTVKLTALIDNEPVTGEFVVSGVYTAGENNTMADLNNSVYLNYSDLETLLADQNRTLEPTMAYLVATDETAASDIKTTITHLGYGGSTQEVMGDQLITMLNILTIVLAGIAGISLLVSSIMILVVLYISVVERTKEIGLLRAIGARSKDVKRIFVSEAFLIGLSSGTLGLLTAIGLSLVVNHFSMEAFNMNVMIITPAYAIFGIVMSTIVSIIAGLFPAKQAAKLDPVDSLRTE